MFRAPCRRFSNAFRPVGPTYHYRLLNTRGHSKDALLTRRIAARLSVGALLTTSSIFLVSTVHGDSSSDEGERASRKDTKPTFGSLIRAYTVYSMCSVPLLVDASPKILSALTSVPIIRQITEAFVRVTFFDQFVGADTAEDAIPLLHTLRAANRGVMFAYSVEVDESEATGASISPSPTIDSPGSLTIPLPLNHVDNKPPHKRIIDEMLHCIDVAADFEVGLEMKNASEIAESEDARRSAASRRTWVAMKMSALLPDSHALLAWSSHITSSRKSLPPSSIEATVPFPGTATIEDMDVILRVPTPDPCSSLSTSYPPLTPTQILHLRELYTDLVRICTHAKEKGVKIVVDAEYSWYQPAIDALTFALMREFNSLDQYQSSGGGSGNVQPLVYATFQAYLRRTPAQLAIALAEARKHNYALGVKLVRGAYHQHELSAHRQASSSSPSMSISRDPEPPVWLNKRDTDDTYNSCVSALVKAVKQDVDRCASLAPGAVPVENKGWFGDLFGGSIAKRSGGRVSGPKSSPSAPGIGVFFGTHNWDSCALILQELKRNGLAVDDTSRRISCVSEEQPEYPIKIVEEAVERVAIGQLYGMSDDLTEWVASRTSCSTPFVIKYVPYGALAQVMPYLSRRAIENKSVLGDGAAHHERRRAAQEIWKRVVG
ncbi:hypothetical protein M413DRAFT_447440 [Hebeloma cylindrosporum]|uniref:Proline dehydrogenase n=1 Tax=Hebeloma cylindrosporum TaxID=76867 RepID=A0A0C3C4A9_HEBCY|nr:hypothetical protein M413DRAFT_447440 [Hebeloma cylindrosporum h7]